MPRTPKTPRPGPPVAAFPTPPTGGRGRPTGPENEGPADPAGRGGSDTGPTEPIRLCINTQTPLVQFLGGPAVAAHRGSGAPPLDLAALTEGVDYRFSPGGVTRMVLPLMRRLLATGEVAHVDWVALNPNAPPTVRAQGLTLHHVEMPPAQMAEYAKAKEAIWGRVHGTDASDHHDDLFWSESFAEYAYYNRLTAGLIERLDAREDFDAFYIHDFQQLPVGHMLHTGKPKLFRWHIPFDEAAIPERWRSILGTYLASYDAVVVSCKAYATSLKSFGFRGRTIRMLPYIDPADYSRPPPEASATALARFQIPSDAPFALVVARMDPTKGQDRAIEALARIVDRHPALRLVLVGNGSFSGSKGGLGLSKSDKWRAHLEATARDRGVADRVTFTGHTSQSELDALYERSAFTILPSVAEGFGLVVVESWLHGRPAVVTNRAGVAELIRPGVNGFLFDPDDPAALDEAMTALAGDPEARDRIGRAGQRTARRCFLDAAVTEERRLLRRVLEA